MKNEIFKIIRTNPFVLIWIIFIIFIFSFGISYMNKKDSFERAFESVYTYDNQEQLKQIIDLKNNELNTYISKTNSNFYEEEINGLKEEIALYEYLYENNISYDSFVISNEIQIYENDKIGFITYMLSFMQIVLLLIFVCINVFIFNEDFSSGMYKYIYGRNIKRNKIIINKTLISSIISIVLIAISIIVTVSLSISYDKNAEYIIYKIGMNIVSIKYTKVILLHIISFIIELLLSNLLIIGISLLSKKPIKAICIGIGYITLIYLVFKAFDIEVFKMLSENSFVFYTNALNVGKTIISFILKLLIVITIFMVGKYMFNRKSIT